MSDTRELKKFFDHMWKDYCEMNPHAAAVYDVLTSYGEIIVNDHIALRTFSLSSINKDVLSQFFLNHGYSLCGEYTFTEKKLTAKHFEHPNADIPKVFISQIELSLLSEASRKIIEKTVASAILNTKESQFLYSGRPWVASYEDYKLLIQESEYAAWVYAHGFRPNHFTVYINELKKLNKIQELNQFLKNKGFKLNSSGGEIKGSPEELLEQSSTMASEIIVKFKEGSFPVPACYYEFAKRYKNKDGKIYQGFIEKSANKIFESTHTFR